LRLRQLADLPQRLTILDPYQRSFRVAVEHRSEVSGCDRPLPCNERLVGKRYHAMTRGITIKLWHPHPLQKTPKPGRLSFRASPRTPLTKPLLIRADTRRVPGRPPTRSQ